MADEQVPQPSAMSGQEVVEAAKKALDQDPTFAPTPPAGQVIESDPIPGHGQTWDGPNIVSREEYEEKYPNAQIPLPPAGLNGEPKTPMVANPDGSEPEAPEEPSVDENNNDSWATAKVNAPTMASAPDAPDTEYTTMDTPVDVPGTLPTTQSFTPIGTTPNTTPWTPNTMPSTVTTETTQNTPPPTTTTPTTTMPSRGEMPIMTPPYPSTTPEAPNGF